MFILPDVLFNLYPVDFCPAFPVINAYITLLNTKSTRFVISKFAQLLVVTTCFFLTGRLTAQPQVSKVFTVRDGLPQSYVSGIFQDKSGFLWISTHNGFSRYDGRGFKHYWHSSRDSAGLSSNIILHILPIGEDQLLLCYMDGKLDIPGKNPLSSSVLRHFP